MKEKLYTIPVNEAFASSCECPICAMKDSLEKEAVEYTMGPSYMEDDIRMETNKKGFCKVHIEQLWNQNNRLGLAFVTSTHMKQVLSDVKELSKSKQSKQSLFKKNDENALTSYLHKLEETCFVCERVERVFVRYLKTIFHLYKQEAGFRSIISSGKGFCNEHYRQLLEGAESELSGAIKDEFINTLHEVYRKNIERVIEDIDWFINKFDYRYQDEPWKNAKDALSRTITKLNGVIIE